MANLMEEDVKLFVEAVQHYFRVTTSDPPQITSAFLGTGEFETEEFNGIVSFSGLYNGHVVVSMPGKLLRELLAMQGEVMFTDANLLDAVGEIANTLAGRARKTLGAGLEISVPVRVQGSPRGKTQVRKHPLVITLKWQRYPATVIVDLERKN
jgi:chemotaxis protein CheX